MRGYLKCKIPLVPKFGVMRCQEKVQSLENKCTLPTQGMRSIISMGSTSPEGFPPSILLLVVIIVAVVLVVVVLAIASVVIVVTE
ncbi:hypothetical protein Tco_0832290 [Tanacetum coccineum]